MANDLSNMEWELLRTHFWRVPEGAWKVSTLQGRAHYGNPSEFQIPPQILKEFHKQPTLKNTYFNMLIEQILLS